MEKRPYDRLSEEQRSKLDSNLEWIKNPLAIYLFELDNTEATIRQAQDQTARFMIGEFAVERFNITEFSDRISKDTLTSLKWEGTAGTAFDGRKVPLNFDDYLTVKAHNLNVGESFNINFQGATSRIFGDAALGGSSFQVFGTGTVGRRGEISVDLDISHAFGYELHNQIGVGEKYIGVDVFKIEKSEINISSPVNVIEGNVQISFKVKMNPFWGTLSPDQLDNWLQIVEASAVDVKKNSTIRSSFEELINRNGDPSVNLKGILVTPKPKPLDQDERDEISMRVKEKLDAGEVTLDEAIEFYNIIQNEDFQHALLQGIKNSNDSCFLSGTPILLADRNYKPIDEIVVGEEVQSYNASGELVAGRVSKIFRNQSKHILDVFGLMITPGHVTYCGDGQFAGQHVPIIDILRTDGALVQADGSMIRATTGYDVGSEEDQFVWAVTGTSQLDSTIIIEDRKQIRVGSRFILDDGRDVCVLDLIKAAGGTLMENGYIRASGSSEQLPFLWILSNELPAPEDYILQRSQVSLTEIYEAGEWDGQRSRLTERDVQSPRTIFTRSEDEIKRGKPNIPVSLQDKLQ
ncbi:Hint domain-containing protein [Pseudovibrio ascidiaceicola]|uniref:Hint domain-containing protein n=1 Tax=Pseudovibrio ascidiaceicola TaxID=285279 RepID=UPI003D367DF9